MNLLAEKNESNQAKSKISIHVYQFYQKQNKPSLQWLIQKIIHQKYL